MSIKTENRQLHIISLDQYRGIKKRIMELKKRRINETSLNKLQNKKNKKSFRLRVLDSFIISLGRSLSYSIPVMSLILLTIVFYRLEEERKLPRTVNIIFENHARPVRSRYIVVDERLLNSFTTGQLWNEITSRGQGEVGRQNLYQRLVLF